MRSRIRGSSVRVDKSCQLSCMFRMMEKFFEEVLVANKSVRYLYQKRVKVEKNQTPD